MADGLNEQQRAAVERSGNVCLASCPGSGKTRVIVAKVLKCIEQVRGTSRRIGCITYTNAGVDEIEDRLRRRGTSADGEYYQVGTIHSFCLNNILRPYAHLIPEIPAMFSVLTTDDDLYKEWVAELARRYRLRNAEESFGQIQREPDGTLFIPDNLTLEAATEFLQRVTAQGYVTFGDIVYYSYLLVSQSTYVARALSSRFAWLLVDEFQDTSACQADILKRIQRCGYTTLFLVGDVNQSIYGFAGSRPTLMGEVALAVGAATDIRLIGNYRCSARIIRYGELLCPCRPPMEAVGESRDFDVEPSYHLVRSTLEAVWDHFLPAIDALHIPLGESAVLAPWWFGFPALARELRERGIPVHGPGARPYKRSHEFAQFAEQLCAYIECSDGPMAVALQRALFFMLMNLSGDAHWAVYSYNGRRVLCRLIETAKRLRSETPAAVDWLLHAANEIAGVLVEEHLLSEEEGETLRVSGSSMVAEVRSKVADAANLHIDEIGVFARPRECLHLLTMHKAKGREFDAVAIVDLHDGKVPNYRARTPEEIAEARRLLYVATTRARKLLMYFSDTSDYRNRPSPFLGELGLCPVPD